MLHADLRFYIFKNWLNEVKYFIFEFAEKLYFIHIVAQKIHKILAINGCSSEEIWNKVEIF